MSATTCLNCVGVLSGLGFGDVCRGGRAGCTRMIFCDVLWRQCHKERGACSTYLQVALVGVGIGLVLLHEGLEQALVEEVGVDAVEERPEHAVAELLETKGRLVSIFLCVWGGHGSLSPSIHTSPQRPQHVPCCSTHPRPRRSERPACRSTPGRAAAAPLLARPSPRRRPATTPSAPVCRRRKESGREVW